MILDTSVIVAIFMEETGSTILRSKIESAPLRAIPAPAFVECAMVLSRRLGADPIPLLNQLLQALGVDVIPFTPQHGRVAGSAFLRFGKGRHPAALNFGDCLVYAAASLANQPLLYVGNDFSQTDLKSA